MLRGTDEVVKKELLAPMAARRGKWLYCHERKTQTGQAQVQIGRGATRHYFTTIGASAGTQAWRYTSNPTSAASAMLCQNR